jgi:hypothetical protein
MLRDLPDGVSCFIDANIICYHLIDLPLLSDECSDFLKRVERGRVTGVTSVAALAEATHKVMLAEAASRHGLDRKGLAHYLQRHPSLLAGLHEHKSVAAIVRALNIRVETITLSLLEAAADLSPRLGLLTNDAITIAVMSSLGLIHLATNDDNFDRVPGITVWKPR